MSESGKASSLITSIHVDSSKATKQGRALTYLVCCNSLEEKAHQPKTDGGRDNVTQRKITFHLSPQESGMWQGRRGGYSREYSSYYPRDRYGTSSSQYQGSYWSQPRRARSLGSLHHPDFVDPYVNYGGWRDQQQYRSSRYYHDPTREWNYNRGGANSYYGRQGRGGNWYDCGTRSKSALGLHRTTEQDYYNGSSSSYWNRQNQAYHDGWYGSSGWRDYGTRSRSALGLYRPEAQTQGTYWDNNVTSLGPVLRSKSAQGFHDDPSYWDHNVTTLGPVLRSRSALGLNRINTDRQGHRSEERL